MVIGNGGEGEPGSIKDRFVMRTRPTDVVRGLNLAMRTLDAEHGYIYLKGSFDVEEERLGEALQGLGLGGAISIHRGDDSYVGGEETALLESIEGRKAWPRPKPPRPTSVGLFGKPTLVQNVDTLARIPDAVAAGAAFPSGETVAFTLWGDVRRPGAYEARKGRTLRSVIEGEGGGALSPPSLIFPNGAQSMPLNAAQIDAPLDPLALKSLGSALGTASILVLGEDCSPLAIADSVARFFERESCGQCPPCVLGSSNLRRLIAGEVSGAHRLSPMGAIRETASFMSMHGYCAHGRAGAAAVTGLYERWHPQFMERLHPGSTRADPGSRDPFADGSPERQALDDFLTRI